MKTEQVKQSLHASDGGIVIPQQPFYKVLDGVCESLFLFKPQQQISPLVSEDEMLTSLLLLLVNLCRLLRFHFDLKRCVL